MTEQDRFLERFEKWRTDGLVDMKFFVGPSINGTSLEAFFASANMMADAVQGGKAHSHSDWPNHYTQRVGTALL